MLYSSSHITQASQHTQPAHPSSRSPSSRKSRALDRWQRGLKNIISTTDGDPNKHNTDASSPLRKGTSSAAQYCESGCSRWPFTLHTRLGLCECTLPLSRTVANCSAIGATKTCLILKTYVSCWSQWLLTSFRPTEKLESAVEDTRLSPLPRIIATTARLLARISSTTPAPAFCQ